MVISLIIIAVILFELIILVGGIYLTSKYISKLKSSVTINRIEVKDKSEKTDEENIKTPVEFIYSTAQQDEPVKKSGGNYVPYGLTESEKNILEMFYEN